ncbi:MAG: capsular polysaccharide synthesis protein [Chitinispirillia bacterium]|nr:capsular polysaccharide synthesis protein [Chitinispirillia bacterium]
MNFKNEIVSKIRYRLKTIRALTDISSQNKIADKLDNYITDFLNGKIERFVSTPKKPELAGKKIIWQYWHQEIDESTSKVVVRCLDSVKKYRGDYSVIMLSKNNISDYAELPDYVWRKLGTDRFNFAKLANLIRLYLLYAYGGVWIDATHYLTKPIEAHILKKDFFAYQRSQIPPIDAAVFKKFDPLYFSWDSKFQVRMLNSFMIAKPDNKICGDLLSILLEYWKRERRAGHYFFKQILFNRMMLNNEWKNLNCGIINDTDCHRLQVISLNKFDRRVYNEIKAKCGIHKLTYRFHRFGQIPADSLLDLFAKGEIEN